MKKAHGQMRCVLILLVLILGAQSATLGQTAVSCDTFGTAWTNPLVWGLQPPCYPDAGVCSEPSWHVTIGPSCFLDLNISPSLETLTLSGAMTSDSANLFVSGTTTLASGAISGQSGTLFASGPLVITGSGANLFSKNLNSSSTATMSDDSSIGASVFQNDGDFHKQGAGTTSTISAQFDSAGALSVDAGTLILTGGGVTSNVVDVQAGAVLELGGPYDLSGILVGQGTVRVDAHLDDVEFSGSWLFSGLTEIVAGNVQFANTGIPASVAMSFGTLTGDLTVGGHLDWTGGTMAAPGTTRLRATADIVDNFLDPKLDGRMLVVEPGAVLNLLSPPPASVAKNGLWGTNGASVHNLGTVTVVDGKPLFALDPADASFENDGLFEKSGPDTAIVQFEFFNRGTVHVTDGRLEFVDDYVQIVNPGTLTDPVTQLGGGIIGDSEAGVLVDIRRGKLSGFGIAEPVVLSTGVISPGTGAESIGILTFEKTLTLGQGSVLEFELESAGGGAGDNHDAIAVFDTLELDGDLLVTFANGFESSVQPGDTFDLANVSSTNAIQGELVGRPSGSQILTADGFGSFTVEYGPGAAFPHLLRLSNYQPASPNPAGRVPDGDGVAGAPLLVDKATGAEITLTWGSSCAAGDTDYEIYQGEIGDYSSHVKMDPCSTAGIASATIAPVPTVSIYYLVVPTNGTNEGSYGLRSDDTERPQPLRPADRCRPQQIVTVCP